jgi:hypothetical protein
MNGVCLDKGYTRLDDGLTREVHGHLGLSEDEKRLK